MQSKSTHLTFPQSQTEAAQRWQQLRISPQTSHGSIGTRFTMRRFKSTAVPSGIFLRFTRFQHIGPKLPVDKLQVIQDPCTLLTWLRWKTFDALKRRALPPLWPPKLSLLSAKPSRKVESLKEVGTCSRERKTSDDPPRAATCRCQL